MKRLLLSILTLLLVLPVAVADITSTTWTKVTSDDDFDLSAQYVMASSKYFCSYSLSSDSGGYLKTTGTSGATSSSTSSIPDDTAIFSFEESNGSYYIKVSTYEGTVKGYLTSTTAKTVNIVSKDQAVAVTITISSGSATITFPKNGNKEVGKLLCNISNTSSYRITTYTSDPSTTMLLPTLYKAPVASKLTATITPKSYDAKELSVGESVAASDLFSVDVADGTDEQKAAAADKLMVKLADDSDDAYVTISDDGKSVKAKNYKSGTNNTISLIGYIKDVDGVTDTETSEKSNTNAFLYVKPYIKLSDLMPEKLFVGQTVYIPVETVPAEAIGSVVVTFLDDDSLKAEVDTEKSVIKFTAIAEDTDNEFSLSFDSNSKYSSGEEIEFKLPVSEGTTPKAVTSEPAATNEEINISAGDAVTFNSVGAGSMQVSITSDSIKDPIVKQYDGSSFTYTFDTAETYIFEITPLTTDTKGLVYYYEDLSTDFMINVEAVEQQAVELEIVGDEAYTIAYNGSVKGGWVTVKDDTQADALKDITYSTEVVAGNPVVSVDTDGNISAGKPGTVKVIASLNSTKYKADPVYITVTINKKPIVLSVNEDAAKEVTVYGEIAAGWLTATMDGTVDADALSAVLYDYNSDYVDVENGKITAKKSGTVTITATIPEENTVYQIGSVTYTITINKAPVTLNSTDKAVATVMEGSTVEDWFAVDLGDLSENEEAQAEVKKHIGYELGEGSADYVTVEEGKITAVAAGEATVTAVLMDNDYFTADPATLTYSLTVTEYREKGSWTHTVTSTSTTGSNIDDFYTLATSTTKSYNVVPSATVPETDPSIGTIEWNIVLEGNASTSVHSTAPYGVQFGTTSKVYDSITLSTKAFSRKKITKVSILIGTTAQKYKYGISCSNGSYDSGVSTVLDASVGTAESNKQYTAVFEPNTCGDELSFSLIYQGGTTTTLKGGVKLCSVTVEYEDAIFATYLFPTNGTDRNVGVGESLTDWLEARVDGSANKDALAAVEYTITEGEEYVSVENGAIIGKKAGKAKVTATIPEGSSYIQLAADASPVNMDITVIPGTPLTTPSADDNHKLYIAPGCDVSYTSAGCDYIHVYVTKDDEVLTDGNMESGYSETYSEDGVYKVKVTPLYAEGEKLLPYDTSYGNIGEYTIIVTPLTVKESDEKLTKDSFNMTDTSWQLYITEENNVKYAAKANVQSNSLNIKTSTTSGDNNRYSGVGSYDNPEGKIIDEIVITESAVADTALVVKMGNDANEISSATTGSSSYFKAASSAVQISRKDGETSSTVFTYKPDAEYKYFHISTAENKAVKIQSIAVHYKNETHKLDPEMELCKDQDGTVAESKVLQYYMSDAYESINFDELIYSSVAATGREKVTNDKTVVTYTSSDPKVATVNKTTGEVTILRMGTTIITATYPGNDNYVPTKASYTINVGFMNPTTEEEGVVPEPLVFDQYDILLPKAFINNVNNGLENYFIETVTLSVRHKPGYLVYYQQDLNTSAGEGTFDKKPTESPAGVRAYDSESNSEEKWEELTMTGSDGDSYATGIFEPYAEGKYASTIKFKAVDAAGNESEEVVLNLSKPTGVSTVEAEESSAEAVYYNLQGQRVKDPERGIYIRVIGNRATKVAM